MMISKAEWEVMRVIWTQGECRSSEVYAVLHRKLAWSESTVKTLLSRLVSKGILARQKQGRSLVYQALVRQDQAVRRQLESSLNLVCQKKQADLLIQLLSDIPMTVADSDRIDEVMRARRQTLLDEVACQCVAGQCACAGCCERSSHDCQTL